MYCSVTKAALLSYRAMAISALLQPLLKQKRFHDLQIYGIYIIKYPENTSEKGYISLEFNSLFSKKAVTALFKAEVSHQVPTRTERGFVISRSDPLGMNKVEGCVILITFFCTFQSPLCSGHKIFNLIRDRIRRPCNGFGFEELH